MSQDSSRQVVPVLGRITNKAGRGGGGDKPRYIRPVERQRMRPWLIAHLDSNDIPGLSWQSKREKVFRISWKHAANQCFNMQKDTNLFERWAVHTGRHHDSDHKRWKANFRCALNSLPDVVEHKDQGIKKGNNAFKVYRFLDEKETKANKESRGRRKKEPPDGDLEEEAGCKDHSYAEYTEGSEDALLTVPRLEHLNLSMGLCSLRNSEELRSLQDHLDDPNLQEILAAATASLAAGSDAVSLEKISIEQLSRLGELSTMKLEISSDGAEENFMYAFLCSWCDKVFPSKIEIFKHFLMVHQAQLLANETYGTGDGSEGGGPPPDPSDPKYQKLQKEIEVLEKEVFHTFQSPADEVENEEVVTITSTADAETQALDLSVKSKGYQPNKQEVALDLSMSGEKRHKSPKTVQPKSATKRRRSSLEIDYTVKFGNYGLAGMPRTKRQMSLHNKKKEEEEEKLAKKMSTEAENADAAEKPAEHSVEDLVHAEILMSLKSGAGDDAEESTDSASTSSKGKKETPLSNKGKKGKVALKKHLMNLERVIDDVAKGAAEDGSEKKGAGKREKDKKPSDTKLKFKAFRCGLCLLRFSDSALLKDHVEEHKLTEKSHNPIVKLKLDPVVPAEQPGYMYYRQVTPGKVQTIWKCQITNSTGPSNIYICRLCQMKFDSLAEIQDHQKVHAEETAVADNDGEEEEKADKDSGAVQYEIEVINDEQEEEQEQEENVKDEGKRAGEQGQEEMEVEMGDSSKVLVERRGDQDGEQMDVATIVEIHEEEVVQQDGTTSRLDAVDGDVAAVIEKPITAVTGVDAEIEKTLYGDTGQGFSSSTVAIEEELEQDTAVIETDANQYETDASNMKMPDFVNTEEMIDAQAESDDVVTVVIADNNSIEAIAADESEAGKSGDGKKNKVIIVRQVDECVDDTDPPDNTKVLQCNVPSFLEVSDSAEVYGIKGEETKEDTKEQEDDGKALQLVNCGICNKQLKLAEIHAHLENHDAEPDGESTLFEPCIICKKMISTKDSIEHLKSHSVFELSLAKNMLVHNQNQLKRQLVVHKMKESEDDTKPVVKVDNIKMFVCNLCSKGFEDIGPLSDHVKQHIRTETPSPPSAKKGDQHKPKDGEGWSDGSGSEPRAVIRKRKTSKSGDKSETAAGKKAKFVVRKDDKSEAAESEESVEIIVGIQKQDATAVDTDAKSNSILAAALNSGPKYPITIPKSGVSSKSTDTSTAGIQIPTSIEGEGSMQSSAAASSGNLPTIMNLPQSIANELMASSAASILASGSLPSIPTTASQDAIQNAAANATQDAALRDSLCVKFPLVLLKSGNDSETNKTDKSSNSSSNSSLYSSSNSSSSTSESIANLMKQTNLQVPVVMKQNNSQVPVVLVRQEKELKLVPMSSVLGLGAAGKINDGGAGPFVKIAGSAANSVLSLGKSGLELGGLDLNVSSASMQGKEFEGGGIVTGVFGKASTMSPLTKPPILYAPVTSHALKSSGLTSVSLVQSSYASPSAATATAKFAPFPMQLFSNQSTQIRVDDGSLKTSLQRQTSDGTATDSADVGVQVNQAKSSKEGKTESQNIIAQLLDAKSKRASQLLSTAQVKTPEGKNEAQKASQQVGAASFAPGQAVNSQGLLQAHSVGTQNLVQAQAIGTQGLIPALIVSTQSLVQAQGQTVSTQTQGLAMPQQVVLSRNQAIMQSLSTVSGAAPIKLLTSEASSNPALAAAQQAPLIIFKRAGTSGGTLEVAATTKQSVDTLPTVLLATSTDKAALASTPSKLGRPPLQGKSLIGPGALQSRIGESTVGTVLTMPTSPIMAPASGIATSPLLSTGSTTQPQPMITTIKQPTTPVAGPTSLPPGIPLQPNFVNMIIQQLIQAQANQAAGSSSTTTTSVTSPTARPTFNLVFAPSTVTATANTTVSVSSVPVSQSVQAQTNINRAPVQTSTHPANPPLMLVCKLCNQSLDSLALMGSHVCPKVALTPVQRTLTVTKPTITLPQKKVAIFKCSLCKDKTFPDYPSYMQHARTHPEIQLKMDTMGKPGQFVQSPQLKCPICLESFQEEDSMNKHIEENHLDSKIKCKYCNKISIGKVDYELHVLYDHPYQCNKCLQRFNNLGLLTAHVMLDLNNIPALSCNKCNLTFPSMESLQTHIFSDHAEADKNIFDCTNSDTLYAYLQRSKSACSCTCTTCNAGFSSTEAMMTHVQKVHFTKIVFTCGVCKDYKMPHRSHLDGHAHFQSQHDVQFCYQCCMLFPNKTVFNKHILMHQGNTHATNTTISKLKSVLKDKSRSVDNSGEGSRLDGSNQEHLDTGKGEVMDMDFDEQAAAVRQITDLDDHDPIANVEINLVDNGKQNIDSVSGDHTHFPHDGNEFLNAYNSENNLVIGVDASVGEGDFAIDKQENIEEEKTVGNIMCTECTLGPFRTKYQLKQHMVIKHLYPRSRTSTSYYQHVIENLKRPKTFECGKCERRFERQNSLYRHQLSHGIGRYACQVADCCLKFGTLRALRQHQNKCRQKSRRPFTRVRNSGQGFVGGDNTGQISNVMSGKYTAVNLPKAVARTTNVIPANALGNFANVYVCTVCNIDCENMTCLKKHIVSEHSDKVAKCDKCSVAFIKNTDSKVHSCAKDDNGSASGDGKNIKLPIKGRKRRLFSCSACNKSFFKLMKLTKHIWEHQDKKKGTNEAEPESLDARDHPKIETKNKVGESEQVDNKEDRGVQKSEKNLNVSDKGWFKCSLCKTVFKESADLFQHVKAHLSPSSASNLARNKLLHAQSVRGDPSQLPDESKGEDLEDEEEGKEESRVMNVMACNQCRGIVYFEEGKLCDSVLNHNCSDSNQS